MKFRLILFIQIYLFRFYAIFLKLLSTRKASTKKSILYLENFPIENAGYQYRAAKWAELMEKEGYKVEIWTLHEDKNAFNQVLNQKNFSRFLIFALKKRFKQVLASRKFETVIVRRELLWFNDYGNLFLDKLLLRFHPNAILDFDDDIAAAKKQPKKITNWYAKLMGENGNKFNESLRMYRKFFVASDYLKEKVLQENPNAKNDSICVIPTCVDYDRYPPKTYPDKINKINIGWIGGNHNYPQLRHIIPTLNELSLKHKFKLLVIGGVPFESDAKFEVEFVPWTLDTEIENMLRIDVGVMPLLDTINSKGKGGFKLIQYMGLGIVSVATGMTINMEIVENEVDSFLIFQNEWYSVLDNLLSQNIDFQKVGNKARKKIESHFTFNSNKLLYLNFIQN